MAVLEIPQPLWKCKSATRIVPRKIHGVPSMFKSIMTSLCICLQGTLFERRAKKGHKKERPETWYYSVEEAETKEPPYLMVAEEFKVKNDLITKLHTRDKNLMGTDVSKAGRARWCPDLYEQCYTPSVKSGADPSVEVYYRALGLFHARDPRTTGNFPAQV
jgi:hypothetical protein